MSIDGEDIQEPSAELVMITSQETDLTVSRKVPSGRTS